MNVVNPDNTEHQIKFIPRLYNVDADILSLYNETSQITSEVVFTRLLQNGYWFLNFEFEFSESDKYQVKVTNISGNIIYRGKLFATSQETQIFKASKDLYYYE